MEITYERTNFGKSAKEVLELFLDMVDPLEKKVIYESMNLPYCPYFYDDMIAEVRFRLAKEVVKNIGNTISKYKFKFKVIDNDLYISNKYEYKKIDRKLLFYFVYSASSNSNVMDKYLDDFLFHDLVAEHLKILVTKNSKELK